MFLIKIYQKTVSPDHGFFAHYFPYGVCKYHPTCSEYGYQAIEKHGVLKGSLLAGWRILRCNPWSKGGIDILEIQNPKSKILNKFKCSKSKFLKPVVDDFEF